MTMTLASLQAALEEYPERLQSALTRQSRAEIALKRIKEQIEEAEAAFTDEDEPEDTPDIKKLKVRYDQKKAQLEIKFRQDPEAFGMGTLKPTEGTVRAVLDADEELCRMKEQLIDLENKQREMRITRFSREREPKTADSKLMQQLWDTEAESVQADIEVQVLQETLDTYKMLTFILANVKSMMNAVGYCSDLG